MPKSIAIVGASADRKKYGNKAVRAFQKGGWTVYPVNAKAETIEGLPCYRSLADVPGPVDRISLYVPPEAGVVLLPEIARTPHTEFFLNPGSESPELIAKARELGLEPVQACSIVSIGLRPDMFPDA
ncbi:MAG: CoA-binding protein [Candidatus Hydrogenedentes bacterium]|nr:CoA-binding protein [Candidatus Hydrogenedentota bacterium]